MGEISRQTFKYICHLSRFLDIPLTNSSYHQCHVLHADNLEYGVNQSISQSINLPRCVKCESMCRYRHSCTIGQPRSMSDNHKAISPKRHLTPATKELRRFIKVRKQERIVQRGAVNTFPALWKNVIL